MVDNEVAALFVSDEGEFRCEPGWVTNGVPWGPAPPVWLRITVPEPVAAGILRLIRERDEQQAAAHTWFDQRNAAMTETRRLQEIEARLSRERDEARELAERYGGLNELWPWELKP